MSKWLKRIRGALGIGLTWAVAWGFVGALLGLSLVGPSAIGAVSLSFALYGFICGGGFSVLLGLTEGRRTFEEMSLKRFAVCGALAPLLMQVMLVTALAFWGDPGQLLNRLISATILALLGAGSAAGSLALARRADHGELLEAGSDVADIGLTQEEKHALLGG